MFRTEIFNNPPYMLAWEEVLNGSRFTFVETGPAITTFPLKREKETLLLYLIKERRDTGEMELKSIGGYCMVGEDYYSCVKRKLLEEGGFDANIDSIMYFGKCPGFNVIKLPINFYYVF